MMWKRKSLSDCEPQAWRNGGGITHELHSWPSPSDWQWRVSVARIERDGTFSEFAGVQRWFAVLEGEGVELSWPDRQLRLSPGDAPCSFAGAPACHARLLAGTTLDFNLMTRHLAGRLWLQRLTGEQTAWPAGAHVGVFACSPCSWTSGTAKQSVDANEFAWTLTTEKTSWQWHSGQALIYCLEKELQP